MQGEGDWSLVLTSPHLNILPGTLSLVLLGELGKINPLSGVRLANISLGQNSVREGFRVNCLGRSKVQKGGKLTGVQKGGRQIN